MFVSFTCALGDFYTALEGATEGGLVPDSALTHWLDASKMPANCVEALVPNFYIVHTIDLLVTAMPNAFSPLWVGADEQIRVVFLAAGCDVYRTSFCDEQRGRIDLGFEEEGEFFHFRKAIFLLLVFRSQSDQ